MIRDLILVAMAATIGVTNATPFKGLDSPPQEHGWGWGGGGGGWGERQPAYDINPHFGFRQYSEMRYEPLTTPYLYNTQLTGPPAPTQPLAPIFTGQGPPYSPNLPQPIRSVGLLAPQQQQHGSGGGGHGSYPINPINNNLYVEDGYLTLVNM